MIDLNYIAEAILLLYHFFTLLTVLIVAYILLRDARSKARVGAAAAGRWNNIIWATGLFGAVALFCLFCGHYLVVQGNLLYSFLALAFGFVACALIYFSSIAKFVQRPAVRYVLFVWVALGLSVIATIGFFAWGNFRASQALHPVSMGEVASGATPILQFSGILIAAVMVAMTNLFNSDQERKNALRQQKSTEVSIYQSLELSSVDLFRFEAQHPNLVLALWYSDADPREPQTPEEMITEHTLEQYVCQHLNLFEMAFRLRRNHVVPSDVYASWVAWMYEICGRPAFAKIWNEGLREHYITDFMRLMDRGVELAALPDDRSAPRGPTQLFYSEVAKAVGGSKPCPRIENWLREAAARS